MKECSRCRKLLARSEFRADAKYADGVSCWCGACTKAYRAEHYQQNKARVQGQNADWHARNREARNARMREAYAADPAKHCARVQAAKARDPDRKVKAAESARRRRAANPAAALRARVSATLNFCLRSGKGGRTSESLLGYSIADLRVHLERQFVSGMSWENMGEWHIDHIVPLSSFTITGPDDPELRRAWALPNLRPLWAKDNIRKGAKRETLL